MEFTIPKTPPRKVQKVKPFPLMESSSSSETEDLNEGEGEDEEDEDANSFDDEKENNGTETSIQVEQQTSINVKSSTPQPSARVSDNIDVDDNSPTLKEKISKLYGYVPEIASHFTIIKRIGEGTFSSVYLARLKHHPEIDQMFALKHIIPTSHPVRIENELKCLLDIGGCDNVMGVKMCVRNRDHVVIVMPYFPHTKFQDFLFQMTLDEGREYMKNLLIALKRVHQFNVIHRDVKPANFLYNRKTKQYALVDFGLASGPFLVDPSKMATHKFTHQASRATTAATTATPSTPSATATASSSFPPPPPSSSSLAKPTTTTATSTTPTSHRTLLSSLSASTLLKAAAKNASGSGGGAVVGGATPIALPSPSAIAAATAAMTTTTTMTAAASRKSPSRQPLSPIKRSDGVAAGRRNLMGRVTKLNERKETPLSSSATRMFAPSFSSASALLRQNSGLCDCFGKPVICELCVARNMQMAPRAGTAGFRAPEVLLKSPIQDTSVDVWSAGVIFLSMMSARYPFFKANDDLGYMAQIISLLGSRPCIKAAQSFGKLLTLSEMIEPSDLQMMCEQLRNTQITAGAATTGQYHLMQQYHHHHHHQQQQQQQQQQQLQKQQPPPPPTASIPTAPKATPTTPTTTNNNTGIPMASPPTPEFDDITAAILDSWADVPFHAYHLLGRLLDPNPKTRITAKEALHHPFFDDHSKTRTPHTAQTPNSISTTTTTSAGKSTNSITTTTPSAPNTNTTSQSAKSGVESAFGTGTGKKKDSSSNRSFTNITITSSNTAFTTSTPKATSVAGAASMKAVPTGNMRACKL